MHISFTAHDPSKSTSSFGLADYLDKENKAYESVENEAGEIENIENEKDNEFESFFDNAFSEENTGQKIDIEKVVRDIDSNRGIRSFKQPNYYMLNVSPNKKELAHMEGLADQELAKRGLVIDSDNKLLNTVYAAQKNELIKLQLKLYTKDLMSEYADHFNREIYVDESKLPDKSQRKELQVETDKEFKAYLRAKGIEIPENTPQQKSNEWVKLHRTKQLDILEEKGRSYRAEITIDNEVKAEVYLPKTLVQEQEDGSYKLPKQLYKQKVKEVKDKNTLVEIDADFIASKTLRNGNVVHNFERIDERFNTSVKLSFNEKDLSKGQGKGLFVSKHLYEKTLHDSINKAISDAYGVKKEAIYNKIASEKGFNLKKRKLTVDDLLWYAKVETQRTHKATDNYVKKNNETLKEIKCLSKHKFLNASKIEALESKLLRDKDNTVIKAGLKKEGLQYHVHIIVSRHDKMMQKPENKMSLSPLANHKKAKMYKGADVGFHRDHFFQKGEALFDKKFEYDRVKEESYQGYKEAKLQRNTTMGRVQRSKTMSKVQGTAKSEVKGFIMKHSGISAIRQEISPVQNIKKQLGVSSIPSRIAKTPLDLAYKLGKKIIDQGLGL